MSDRFVRRHAMRAVALAALALAACASLPRLEPPQVVATHVRVAQMRLPDVRLAIEVTLRNPNARAIDVEALDATLALPPQTIGQATLARPVTLPAHGEARVQLDVRADASLALASVGAALGAARPLDYELAGTLQLADGTRWPFRRRGSLPDERRR